MPSSGFGKSLRNKETDRPRFRVNIENELRAIQARPLHEAHAEFAKARCPARVQLDGFQMYFPAALM
jgi:ferredoxin-thioredoxin reductase catalytic subunit